MAIQSNMSPTQTAKSQPHSISNTVINVVGLGWALSSFAVITYVLCIALGIVIPDWEMHRPWLQFFPGFEWLTAKGFLIGLVEAFLYGWYTALVFGPLYNFFSATRS